MKLSAIPTIYPLALEMKILTLKYISINMVIVVTIVFIVPTAIYFKKELFKLVNVRNLRFPFCGNINLSLFKQLILV